MKILSSFVLLFAIVFSSFSSSANTVDENYFLGTWDVLIKGTPNGDAVIPFTFAKKEGKLTGKLVNPESKEEMDVTSIEINGDVVTVAFSMMGYDLTLVLTKKDEDHANGKLMDMFDCEATRKK
jgi:hypothetical protein